MKKIFWVFFFLTILFPSITAALCNDGQGGIVPCGNTPQCPCQIGHFFVMLANIYDFIVKQIATPLATIALAIGGIVLMLSAGNPEAASLGKKILWSAIIGLALVWCSWVIVNLIMTTISYTGNWSQL